MSAFVCNYITFSRVAEVVQMEYKHKTIDKEQLVNDLFQMNIRAYNARYETNVKDDRKLPYFEQTNYPIAFLLLACDCFLYQCTEGDVFEDQLFVYVENACHNQYRRIAERCTGKPYYSFSVLEAKKITKKYFKLPEAAQHEAWT